MLGSFTPEPQVLALLNIHWKDVADDAVVEEAAQEWLRLANLEAERVNPHSDHKSGDKGWVYLNYAHETQRPFGEAEDEDGEGRGKGIGRVEFMRSVSREVDPRGFFQRSVVGGFKIPEEMAEERCTGEI